MASYVSVLPQISSSATHTPPSTGGVYQQIGSCGTSLIQLATRVILAVFHALKNLVVFLMTTAAKLTGSLCGSATPITASASERTISSVPVSVVIRGQAQNLQNFVEEQQRTSQVAPPAVTPTGSAADPAPRTTGPASRGTAPTDAEIDEQRIIFESIQAAARPTQPEAPIAPPAGEILHADPVAAVTAPLQQDFIAYLQEKITTLTASYEGMRPLLMTDNPVGFRLIARHIFENFPTDSGQAPAVIPAFFQERVDANATLTIQQTIENLHLRLRRTPAEEIQPVQQAATEFVDKLTRNPQFRAHVFDVCRLFREAHAAPTPAPTPARASSPPRIGAFCVSAPPIPQNPAPAPAASPAGQTIAPTAEVLTQRTNTPEAFMAIARSTIDTYLDSEEEGPGCLNQPVGGLDRQTFKEALDALHRRKDQLDPQEFERRKTHLVNKLAQSAQFQALVNNAVQTAF